MAKEHAEGVKSDAGYPENNPASHEDVQAAEQEVQEVEESQTAKGD